MLLETSIFRVREDLAEHPRTGRRGSYYVLDGPDWVNVVASTEGGELVLVRQWRHGTRAFELELPAGVIEPGEDPLAAAARELTEETGFLPGSLRMLGSLRPNPAIEANTCFTVRAEGCRAGGLVALDPGEDIEVLTVSPEALDELVRDGSIRGALVLAALALWRASPGG